jgi:cardiolipin synthase A/B
MVRGAAFISALRGIEDSYREHSRELTLDEWMARPLVRRILDHVARLTAALQ